MGFIDKVTGEQIDIVSITENSFLIFKPWSGKYQSLSIEMFNRFYTEDENEMPDLS